MDTSSGVFCIHYYEFPTDNYFEKCIVAEDMQQAVYLFERDHKQCKILCVVDQCVVDDDMYSVYSNAFEDFLDIYEGCIYIKKENK